MASGGSYAFAVGSFVYCDGVVGVAGTVVLVDAARSAIRLDCAVIVLLLAVGCVRAWRGFGLAGEVVGARFWGGGGVLAVRRADLSGCFRYECSIDIGIGVGGSVDLCG